MVKGLNRYYSEEDIQMVNNNHQLLGKCKSKPQDIPSHLFEWLSSKLQQIASVGKDMEKSALLMGM